MAAKKKLKTTTKRKPSAKRRRAGAPESVAISKSKSKTQPSSSLFENLWTRRKFDVLGKKRKGEERRVGLSRSLAIEKRKKTILQEFKERGKSNAFLDHRFGEDDEALPEEDKAILRFQRERQAQWQRKSKFALPDEDDDDAVLTHGGTALSMLDDFKDDISEDDDDDGQELNEELVRELHFGGGDNIKGNNQFGGNEHQKKSKSKKEIMEEIIAKSKFYKAQKAKEKEEDAELKDQLDKEFATLAQSQALISLVRPQKINALKSMLSRPSGKEGITAASPDVADNKSREKEKPDDFDKLVKEMGMELRAHASDRLKTDEELAKEEKARLEELEEKRKRRMLGEMDSDESEEEDMNDVENITKRKKKRLEISGDDLGENFLMDDDQHERGWVDEVLGRTSDGDGEDSSADEDEENNSSDEDGISRESADDDDDDNSNSDREGLSEGKGSDQEWEQSDEDNLKASPDKQIMKQEGELYDQIKKGIAEGKKGAGLNKESRGILNKKGAQGLQSPSNIEPLPFVIEAPKSLEELRRLVDNRSVEDLLVAIQRIRTCNAIRLAAENRRKMQVFYGVLLQYFAALAGEKTYDPDRLNALVKPLIEMSSETPYFAAVCAQQRLVRMQHQLSDKLRDPDVNGHWPSVRTLMQLRLWSMIFPPSDFRHVVMTPSILLMAEYLVRCPVNSGRDIAVGAFLCALLLSVMRQARRFCPEALSFLHAVLISALPKKNISIDSVDTSGCAAFMVELVASQSWLLVGSDCSTFTDEGDLDFNYIMAANSTSPFFSSDRFRVAVLNSAIRILKGFSHIYEDITCFPEIFHPFIPVLQNLSAGRRLPQSIVTSLSELIQHLKQNIDKHERLRQPLRMRIKKPVPIKQYNPKFEENFVQGRNYDPDRERAERKKVQRLLKQEAKGAARELRKDNYFLQEEKAKEKALIEEERDEKYRKAMSFLQEQESAFKSGQLGKGRKRRR